MRPAVNSDESVTLNRSAQDYPSRSRKEQISRPENAQTKYETHLSRNDAHSSTYGSTRAALDWHVANREWYVYTMIEDQRNVPTVSSDGISQNHKGVSTTHDIDPPRRYQSVNTDEPSLWCVRCYRNKKKKFRKVEQRPRKSARRLFDRIKKRCRRSEKPDDEAIAGVSTEPLRKSMKHPSTPEKSKRSHKEDASVEEAGMDVTERNGKERRTRRDSEQEGRRRERKERERKERRERREERISRVMDAQSTTQQPEDPLKSCCYLCAQNTLAIAAATGFKSEQCDKCIQVSAHKFHTVTLAFDKSCSASLLVRTVQSSVKVKTRETSTLCPDARHRDTPKTKRKKLSVFPRLTWTKCPARRVACETDKSAKRDNAEKRERPKNEKCCGEKNA